MTCLTGADYRALRRACGMSVTEFGRALGYKGTDATLKRDLRRVEALEEIPAQICERISAIFRAAAARNTRRTRPDEARP